MSKLNAKELQQHYAFSEIQQHLIDTKIHTLQSIVDLDATEQTLFLENFLDLIPSFIHLSGELPSKIEQLRKIVQLREQACSVNVVKALIGDKDRLHCILMHWNAFNAIISTDAYPDGKVFFGPFVGMDLALLETMLQNKSRFDALTDKPSALEALVVNDNRNLPQLHTLKVHHTTDAFNALRQKRYNTWFAAAAITAVAGTTLGLAAVMVPLLSTLVLSATASTVLMALGAVLLAATIATTAVFANHANRCTPKQLTARFADEQRSLTQKLDAIAPVESKP